MTQSEKLRQLLELANKAAATGLDMTKSDGDVYQVQPKLRSWYPPDRPERPTYVLPRYIPFSGAIGWRRVSPPITLHGKPVSRYQATTIMEYVDTETGEIIPQNMVRNDPDLRPTIREGERSLQREGLMTALRPEVRKFGRFVLQFRNQRWSRRVGQDFGFLK